MQQAAAAEMRNKELDQCKVWEKSRTATKQQKAYAQQMLRGAAQDTQEAPDNVGLQAFCRARQQQLESKIQERCREIGEAGAGGGDGQPVPVLRLRISEVVPALMTSSTPGTGVTSVTRDTNVKTGDPMCEDKPGTAPPGDRPSEQTPLPALPAVPAAAPSAGNSSSSRWGSSGGRHALVKVWRPPEELREVTEGGVWLVVGLQAHGMSGECGPGGRLLELQSNRHTR